jgi:hypothetical protein
MMEIVWRFPLPELIRSEVVFSCPEKSSKKPEELPILGRDDEER